ncbi:MAG: NAD(+) diphosphatase [Clostridiales bacterium]|nr:NAD(+) diphosphatase [Clostridiales bacterium]MBP3811053.1 NAD(+) diphosphatase [Clostridiales bacterium]
MIQDIYPHKLKNTFIPGLEADASSMVIHFNKDGMILIKSQGKPFPRLSEFKTSPDTLTYLFSMDEDNFFLAEDETVVLPEGTEYKRVREFRKMDVPKKSVFEAFTAKQLNSWYVNNRYCGRCGELTGRSRIERAIVCEKCGNTIYPRVVPAVIVGLIKRGASRDEDEILLTKYNGRSDVPYYALIAGFTEIGETFEQTVAREASEETGLKVKNIRYYKSQPWGVVDDILAGFYCELDGSDQITRDEGELSVAEWVRRENVVLQPDDFSLTNEMMTLFKEGREPV